MEINKRFDWEVDFSQISDEYVGDSLVINKKEGPCGEFKKNLSICMKNSDDNIILCQDMRNIFEDCLKNENKKK